MNIDTTFDRQTDLKDNSLRTNMNIVNIQTNDIFILIDSNFATAEEKAIVNAKIMTKSRNDLDSNSSLKFNDTVIERQENDIHLRQIAQFDHFQFVKIVNFIIFNFKNKIKFALISKKQYVVTTSSRSVYRIYLSIEDFIRFIFRSSINWDFVKEYRDFE
jgi:hypothetical protein